MRLFAFLLLISILVSTCARRPVQQDLPHSAGNSADHSGRRNSNAESSPNAASAPFELQFFDTMIAAHEAIIDSAQLAQTRAGSDQIKSLANDVIAEHRSELGDLRSSREKFFAGTPQAINLELPGAADMFNAIDAEKLDDLKERPFDEEFVRELEAAFEASLRLATPLTSKPQVADETDLIVSTREIATRLVNDRNRNLQRLALLQKSSK